MRPPHTQDVAVTRRGSQQSQFSTATEESRGRCSQKKPQLEGYVQPQQASPHTLAGQCLAVETLIGCGSVNQHHSGRHLQRVIEETVSKVREEEEVVEGDDGEGIPYDPNLVCPKWFTHFCSFFTNVYFQCVCCVMPRGSLGNLLSNGGSFLGVLSKAFCALQSHLKFLQLFSGGGGSLYLLFGATG